MSAIFGPAGNAESFPYKSSVDAPRWLAGLGLDCYEYQCGKGVNVGEATARKVGEAAREAGIALSLHAPYFINLANPDPDSLQKTIGYITAACQAADWMGATRVVIHSGALMKRTRREAQDIALHALKEVVAACDGAGFGHITLCPETMGKINQLGDLDEVLELCTLDERLTPCVDFGHLYARSLGADDGPEVFERMLDRVEEVLGPDRAGRFHSHFSHIEFTPKGGEKCHRTFADDGGFGPDWTPLAQEIARRNWSPTFICESAGTQAEDAADGGHAVFHGMEAAPHAADAEGATGEHEVLRGGGAVLHPEALGFFRIEVAADHDGQRRVGGHLGIGMLGGDAVEGSPVVHHHEMPGLAVAGAGGEHGGLQHDAHVLLRDGLAGVLADAAPGAERFKEFHNDLL